MPTGWLHHGYFAQDYLQIPEQYLSYLAAACDHWIKSLSC